MGNISQSKTYTGIDFMRFICAILVVVIHTNPLSVISDNMNYFVVNIIARISVPFFFICSGYFLADKLHIEDKIRRKKSIKKYLLGITKTYIIWTIVYSILNYSQYFKGNMVKGLIIYVRNFLFVGINFHLWYIASLVASVYFIYIFLNKFEIKHLLGISIIIYLFSLVGSSYYGFVENNIIGRIVNIYVIFFGQLNSFIMGVPFIVIGICIKRYLKENTLKNIENTFFITFLLYVVEKFILKKLGVIASNYTSIFLPIVVVSIFSLLINNENKIRNSIIARKYSNILKEWSLNIYLSHGIFLIILPKVYSTLNIYENKWFGILNLFLVLILSILMAEVIRRIKQMKKNAVARC